MVGQMQQQIQNKQAEAEQTIHEGSAAGGKVRVTVKGTFEVLSVSIDESLNEDLEMIEDLLLVATNNAITKAKEHIQTTMSEVTAGLPIPPGLLGF
jgi:hypothetical protein